MADAGASSEYMKSGWAVNLIGDPADLRELESINFPPQTELEVEGERFYIRLLSASATEDAWKVYSLAEEAMKVVNGTARLYVDGWRNVTCGGPVYVGPDGRRNLFALVQEINVRARMSTATVTVTDAAGNVINAPVTPKPAEKAISAAGREQAVEKVLRLYGSTDLTYRDLYVIYEVVEENVGGIDAAAAMSGIAKVDLKRFKHTANSVAILGDASRHGTESTDPPKQPVALDEARTMIDKLVKVWIASKP